MKILNKMKKQLGIGLLELMLSLAIISLLLVMATRYFMSADLNSKIVQVIDVSGGVAACVAYQEELGTKTFGIDEITSCVNNKIMPKSIVVYDGDTIKGIKLPWVDGNAAIPTRVDNDVVITLNPNDEAIVKDLALKLCPNFVKQLGGAKTLKYGVMLQQCYLN